jgi:hypothetical protein
MSHRRELATELLRMCCQHLRAARIHSAAAISSELNCELGVERFWSAAVAWEARKALNGGAS